MPRFALPRIPFLAVLVLGCGAGDPELPDAPRPPNLTQLNAAATTRILRYLAQVEAEPRRAQAWAELGFVYGAERLKGLGIECFRVAGRLEPRQPRWPYHEAILLGREASFEAAILALQRALELEPGYPPTHARLGEFRLALGDLDGAERDFRRATVLDSSYPGGWLGLARVALQRDRAFEAVEILERLRKDDPEDSTFQQLLAIAEREAGGASSVAVASLLSEDQLPVWNDPWALEARAFQADPASREVSQLFEEGKVSEALALLEQKRSAGREPITTGLAIAKARRLLGQSDLAMAEVEAVLAREPDNSSAILFKASLLEDRGDLAQAVELLERVTALQPNFGAAFAAMARELASLREHERAVEAFRRARELGVEDFELSFAIGNCLIVLKRWDEAQEIFGALVRERPEHGNSWLELAVARFRSGQLERAEEALERARASGNASPELLGNVENSLQGARERRARKAGPEGGRGDDDP